LLEQGVNLEKLIVGRLALQDLDLLGSLVELLKER
jgi:hypothetical protein